VGTGGWVARQTSSLAHYSTFIVTLSLPPAVTATKPTNQPKLPAWLPANQLPGHFQLPFYLNLHHHQSLAENHNIAQPALHRCQVPPPTIFPPQLPSSCTSRHHEGHFQGNRRPARHLASSHMPWTVRCGLRIAHCGEPTSGCTQLLLELYLRQSEPIALPCLRPFTVNHVANRPCLLQDLKQNKFTIDVEPTELVCRHCPLPPNLASIATSPPPVSRHRKGPCPPLPGRRGIQPAALG
jgi:hypothetical protein